MYGTSTCLNWDEEKDIFIIHKNGIPIFVCYDFSKIFPEVLTRDIVMVYNDIKSIFNFKGGMI